MPVILCGGGHGPKNPRAFQLFYDSVDKTKPVLYIDFAGRRANYAEAYASFVSRMADNGIYCSRLCNDVSLFGEYELDSFGGIFCEGGNTFRLMKMLRDSGGADKIADYLKRGGVWCGSSAGAIVGGADIMPIIYMDANNVLLEDTRGLDMMDGWSTVAHYGDGKTDEINEEWDRAVDILAKKYDKLIALSEESAIVIEPGKRKYVLGEPCKMYKNGVAFMVNDGECFD